MVNEKDKKQKKKRLKDKIPVKSDNEKQYNITLKGYEKALAENMKIAGIKAERLGIKYSYENNKDPEVLELESNIAYYEFKVHERRLELVAFLNELDKLKKQLKELNSTIIKKEKLNKHIYELYLEFLEEGFTDLKEFYSINNKYYSDISIIGMKLGFDNIEDIIKIFEEYLEELEEKTALDSSDNIKTEVK